MAGSVIAAIVLSLLAPGPTGPQGGSTQDAAQQSDEPVVTGFLYRTIVIRGEEYAYCLYVPPEYDPTRPWPTVLFLHGSGKRGADGFAHTEEGIAHAIRQNRRLCPAVVVMPQCRPNRFWDGEMLEMALRCVEDASTGFHLDPERVYLTGISLGGAGAWRLGAQMADRLAALVPVCGFHLLPNQPADPEVLEREAAELAGLPIWTFHGTADRAVPVERTREIVQAVRAAGGEVRYTEFEEAGHTIWNRVYKDPDFWRWLLAQRREPSRIRQPATAPAPSSQPRRPEPQP